VSYQTEFCEWLMTDDLAESATLTVVTGEACPCVAASLDGHTPSRQWHADNPGEPDCSGTGLINVNSTVTNIKGIFWPPGMGGSTVPTLLEYREAIGEIKKEDLFLLGAVNTANGSFVDLTGKSEYHDYITKNSQKYLIRDVSDVPAGAGQMAHLVPRTN
jgi:hypothetical protein